MTKHILAKKIIIFELIGFAIIMFFLFADEILDIPHTVFGTPSTPINWFEMFIEVAFTFILCIFVIFWTWRLLKQIKYLEGILPICSFCKKIRLKNDWTTIEEYVSKHSEAEFSHGLCPECAEKYYGDVLHKNKHKSV